MSKKFIQYGAGNIGRSLVGQLFSKAGYEVVFIDVDEKIIDALNRERKYLIQVKDEVPQDIWVENVRGVNGNDIEAVVNEIATADMMATAVGTNALKYIYEVIAKGIKERKEPINIIICENLRHMSKIVRESLTQYLPEGFPFQERVGLVETTIGKMVPIMPKEISEKDPLLVWSEAYNLLYAAKDGFIGEIPDIEGLIVKSNFDAYVDRKLFIHNLGHAITAYLGYLVDPDNIYISTAIENEFVRHITEAAMWESGRALIREYPFEFDEDSQREHINDLICRFGNIHLGDTIYRVGRDVPRKIGFNERLIGAARLGIKNNIMPKYTAMGVAAAFFFRAVDQNGEMYENDKVFAEELERHGVNYILSNICGLDSKKHGALMALIRHAHKLLIGWARGMRQAKFEDNEEK
ncbi:mannitol-1-phosphate 5-dehydrogenase [Candidatus Poribacteria bacterium]|nr:mannitol-1-phosphate 5-dehydrogenase [Candidatus Poribacteria bacterium]